MVWVIGPVVLIGLLAFAVLATRGPAPATAFTLKVGNCFDVPGDAQIGDIAVLDCAKPHDAEVFAAGNLVEADATAPIAYPGITGVSAWVDKACGPGAVRAYAGQTASANLAVGYFFPDENAWSRGERQVTCYLHTRDGSKLSAPLSAESGAAPS